ncbi:MAG: aldose 1-epimerase family protein, partial [Vallitaleaceae bacterium]|nr:aldose 1-epimerase family protein [Vallitaleaceae bacterium]
MLDKRELMTRVGSMEQLAYARRMIVAEGPAKGSNIVQVQCGELSYTVLLDRAIDIAGVTYKGIPISYISKTGLTTVYSYEEEGLGFLRSFTGGLLTTCGLTHFGAPCTDNGEKLGLHGRATSLRGSDICISQEFEDGKYTIRISGKIRESRVFGENIVLKREIVSRLYDNIIEIHDSIENEGFDTSPFMLLYHCNFGYPLLDSNTKLIIDTTETITRDLEAVKGLSNYRECQAPEKSYKEQVFYHKPQVSALGWANAGLKNDDLGIRVTLSYDTK